MEKNNTLLENKEIVGNNKTREQDKADDKILLVKDFIVDNFLFGDSGNLKNDTDLFKESIVDSTGILELIAFLETTFNIRVNDDEIVQENFCSIISIKNYIFSKTITTSNTLCAE